MRFQEQIAGQKRIEELLYEIRTLERRIQFYDKGFSAWDCLRSTGNKSSIENKHWNHGGYNFDRWLEDARGCTLVENFFGEEVQSDLKQGNFVSIDSCFNLIEKENKMIEELISKFDDGELVDNKDLFIFYDKCIILEE